MLRVQRHVCLIVTFLFLTKVLFGCWSRFCLFEATQNSLSAMKTGSRASLTLWWLRTKELAYARGWDGAILTKN